MSADQNKKAPQTLTQELSGIFSSYLQTYLVAFISFSLLFPIYAGIKTLPVVQVLATIATFLSVAFALFILLLYLDQRHTKRSSSRAANSQTVVHTTTTHSECVPLSASVQDRPQHSDSDDFTIPVTVHGEYPNEITIRLRIATPELRSTFNSLPEVERRQMIERFLQWHSTPETTIYHTLDSIHAFSGFFSQFAKRVLGLSADQVIHRARK